MTRPLRLLALLALCLPVACKDPSNPSPDDFLRTTSQAAVVSEGALRNRAGVDVSWALAFLVDGDVNAQGRREVIGLQSGTNFLYIWDSDEWGGYELRCDGYLKDSNNFDLTVDRLAFVVSGDFDGDGWTEWAGLLKGTNTVYIWQADGCGGSPSWPDGGPVASGVFTPAYQGSLLNSSSTPVPVDLLKHVVAADFVGDHRVEIRALQKGTSWQYIWGLDSPLYWQTVLLHEGPLQDKNGNSVPVDDITYVTVTRKDTATTPGVSSNTPGPWLLLATTQDRFFAWGTPPVPVWSREFFKGPPEDGPKPKLIFSIDPASNSLIVNADPSVPSNAQTRTPYLAALDRVVAALNKFKPKFEVYVLVNPMVADKTRLHYVLKYFADRDIPFVLDAYASDTNRISFKTGAVDRPFDPAHGLALSPWDVDPASDLGLESYAQKYGAKFAGLRFHEVIGLDDYLWQCITQAPGFLPASYCFRENWVPQGEWDPFYTYWRAHALVRFASIKTPHRFVLVGDNKWHRPYGNVHRLDDYRDDIDLLASTYPGTIYKQYNNNEGVVFGGVPCAADQKCVLRPRNYRLQRWHEGVRPAFGMAGFGLSNQSWLCDREDLYGDQNCPKEDIAMWASDALQKGASTVQFEPFSYFFRWPRSEANASPTVYDPVTGAGSTNSIDWGAAGDPTPNLHHLAATLGVTL